MKVIIRIALSIVPLFGALFFAIAPLLAHADISFSPATTLNPCDDYATLVLGDPWDMSNKEDIVNFIPLDLTYISNPAFNSGEFSFTTTETNGGTVRFLAPQLPATLPLGGRWGANNPIDTQKYTHFTLRMATEALDSGYGLALVWNRSQNYGKENSYTQYTPTVPQKSTYTIDLSSIAIDSSRSDNLNPWQSGSIEGFGILPTVTKQSVTFDYARLEDPNSCGIGAITYTVTPSSGALLHNLYLDDDGTPFNGYIKKIVSGGTGNGSLSTTVSSLGLPPGSYYVSGFQTSDYATVSRNDPWDFNSLNDLLTTAGASNSSITNGKFAAVGNNPVLYLRLNPSENINATTFNKLSFKISPRTDVVVSYDNGSGITSVAATKNGADPDADGIYTLDLSGKPGWNGSINTLALSLNYPLNTPFEIDFVELNQGDFSLNDTLPITFSQSSSLKVFAPPLIKLQQPDLKGGIGVKPWNYLPGDVAFSENLITTSDPSVPGEPLSAYLPDTRLIGGVRGNFYKGTNSPGNDDPHDFLFFPYFTRTNNYTVDADSYRFMCVKMMIDREFDLGLGSVARLSFIGADDITRVTEEWGVISDRWSGNRWYEFCGDLATFFSEGDEGFHWKGEVKSLRLDPHEFHLDTCCTAAGAPFGSPTNATYYLDYLKLRRMDESRGKYALVFTKSDQDSLTTSTRFFYNSIRSTTGATEIPSSSLSCEGEVCIWDTTAVPVGTYWVLGEVSDGNLSTSRLSTGQLKVSNQGATQTSPTLIVESPQQDQVVCSTLQIKGYSLIPDRYEDVSAVQIFIDGVHFRTIYPQLYHPTAASQFSLADSSNAGFDENHDVSSLSTGTHTIDVKSYSSDGGITAESRRINKQVGCSDSAILDPLPNAPAQQIIRREDLAPGDTIALGLEPNANNLRFLISGTRHCQMVRIGVSLKSGGPYTYIYANTNPSTIDTSFVTALSEGLPRYTATIVSSKQLATLKKQILLTTRNVKKKSAQCKAIKDVRKKSLCLRDVKKLNTQLTSLKKRLQKSSTHNGTISYIADCDQGVHISSEQRFNTRDISCPAGASCTAFTNITQWFNTVVTKHRPG